MSKNTCTSVHEAYQCIRIKVCKETFTDLADKVDKKREDEGNVEACEPRGAEHTRKGRRALIARLGRRGP
jgi:hypothetical protein